VSRRGSTHVMCEFQRSNALEPTGLPTALRTQNASWNRSDRSNRSFVSECSGSSGFRVQGVTGL